MHLNTLLGPWSQPQSPANQEPWQGKCQGTKYYKVSGQLQPVAPPTSLPKPMRGQRRPAGESEPALPVDGQASLPALAFLNQQCLATSMVWIPRIPVIILPTKAAILMQLNYFHLYTNFCIFHFLSVHQQASITLSTCRAVCICIPLKHSCIVHGIAPPYQVHSSQYQSKNCH